MIIYINGSMNSGKSTAARYLYSNLKNSALVEIDWIYRMTEWMPINQAVPLNLKNTVSLIRNFSGNNINCIVPYPLTKENYKYLTDNLKDIKVEKIFFTLKPPMSSAVKNRGSRELSQGEVDKIKIHYNAGIFNPSGGVIIDNDKLTPEETGRILLSEISIRCN